MDKQSMLIAETDADGTIAWIWRVDPGKRPGLVKDAAACLPDLESFIIHGAGREDVAAWLRRQPNASAS